MTTIRQTLANWGLAQKHVTPTERRIAAEKILRDGCSAGGQPTTASERRALTAIVDGATLDDRLPPDPTDAVAVLCAAIDEGDDTALLPLADLLEEAGDARAAGLRRLNSTILPARAKNVEDRTIWMWEPIRPRRVKLPHHIPRELFDRLPPLNVTGRSGAPALAYDSRSGAYLALAAALV